VREGSPTVSTAHSSDGDVVLAGHKTKVEDEEGGGDGPVDIAGVEKLPASSDGGPSLPREHSEVGKGRHAADEGVAEVVLPALRIGVGSLVSSPRQDRDGRFAHANGGSVRPLRRV
jgi:hypothetical protein